MYNFGLYCQFNIVNQLGENIVCLELKGGSYLIIGVKTKFFQNYDEDWLMIVIPTKCSFKPFPPKD